MTKHARLSASASERWLSCPASVLAIEELPSDDSPNVYADEGTAAHALAEITAAHHFGLVGDKQFKAEYDAWAIEWDQFTKDPEWVADCRRHVAGYIKLIQSVYDESPHSQLFLEARLNSGISDCWGTSDAVVVSPNKVTIIDLKYGAGVRVDAEANPQLKIYALGALDEYGDLLDTTYDVQWYIYQPRLDHVSTDLCSADQLREWREEVRPIAESALEPGAPFGPSEDACRWCPLSGRCRAQLEDIFSVPMNEPAALTPEEIADALSAVPRIRKWLGQLEVAALNMAYSEGTNIPGYKVVKSGGVRKLNDVEGAKQILNAMGFSDDQFGDWEMHGVTKLEKLIGKKDFAAYLADYFPKTPGKPALAPESDSRPAINPESEAKKDFEPMEDDE